MSYAAGVASSRYVTLLREAKGCGEAEKPKREKSKKEKEQG